MSRELLQQALDALTVLLDEWTPARKAQLKGTDVITALREAIAAPMPEPVAWLCENAAGHRYFRWKKPMSEYKPVPLYAAPPAAPAPVVPLTDERAAFEAWIRKDSGDLTTFGQGANMHYRNSAVNNAWTGWHARAVLSTAPVVPLTDEQINDIWNAKDLPEHRSHLSPWGMDRIRAIIAAANGIGGGGNG